MSVKKLTIIAAVVIAAVLSGILVYCSKNEPEMYESEIDDFESELYEESSSDAIPVDVYDFSQHSRDGIVSAYGEAVSTKISKITAPLTSAVTEVYVSLGQYVSEGDKICEFDTLEIQGRIDELESEDEKTAYEANITHKRNEEALNKAIDSQEKQVAAAEAEMQKIRAEINKILDKGHTFTISEDEDEDDNEDVFKLEELNTALEDAAENLETIWELTNEEIKSCREAIEDENLNKTDNSKELETLRRQLASAVVTAPQDGVITSLDIQKGSSPSEILCTISDMSSISLKVNVKESDILNIHPGMNAYISAAASDKILRGVVSDLNMVANIGDESENTYTVMLIPVDNFVWSAGMKVSADIILRERKFIYDVPKEYIHTDNEGSYVFIAENNYHGGYTAVKKQIEIGLEHPGDLVEVNFDGINKNSKIVICSDPYEEIYDGAEIELTSDPGL